MGAIGFRQGPGVISSTDTITWAEFTVTFVGAALKIVGPYNNLKKCPFSAGGLKDPRNNGAVSSVSDSKISVRITGKAKGSVKVDGIQLAPSDKD